MIPEFDDNGYLPPGVYAASIDEIAERFGSQSEVRQAEMESLRWLVPLAKRAGIQRLIINGSFVTSVDEPNDVDCVLLTDEDYPKDHLLHRELVQGLPFLEVKLVVQDAFDDYVNSVFSTDRDMVPKGMIEVIL
jgi:hypothetical protein